ncbi:hypothetical protein ES702_04116 [subsurface metagenome]
MPKKDERITAVHLMVIFKENIGLARRFMEIYNTMRERGFKHNFNSISDNLKYLVSQGKIVRYEWNKNPRYGMPETRENGSKFIIVRNQNLPDETIEIE